MVHWLSYSTNKGYTDLTQETLDGFEKEYLSKRKHSTPSSVKSKPITQNLPSLAHLADDEDMIISAYGGSPAHNVSGYCYYCHLTS